MGNVFWLLQDLHLKPFQALFHFALLALWTKVDRTCLRWILLKSLSMKGTVACPQREIAMVDVVCHHLPPKSRFPAHFHPKRNRVAIGINQKNALDVVQIKEPIASRVYYSWAQAIIIGRSK